MTADSAQAIADLQALIDWHVADAMEGDDEFFRHDGYVLTLGDMKAAVAALRSAPPPDLPSALSSVEDVVAVCEAAGLSEDDGHSGASPRERSWEDGMVCASDSGGGLWVRTRGRGTSWINTTWYRQPTALLWAGIAAARVSTPGDPDVRT